MNQDAKIGQRLKNFRELKGVTQYEMADFANISKNYISALERDKNNPSIQVVFAYCQKLNITPNEILGFNSDTVLPELMEILKTLSYEEQLKLLKMLQIFKN